MKKATDLARDLITKYGMSDHLVPRIYGEKEELVFLGRDIKEQRNYICCLITNIFFTDVLIVNN